jgi:REP element-mobilizing transposase RayT
MPHTYSVNLVHCVFSTKGRLPLIRDPQQSWTILSTVARNAKIGLLAAGGTANHVHLLLHIPKTRTVADCMREIKANSSSRLRRSNPGFAWQDGYGTISVSPTAVKAVTRYIERQAEHHSSRSFEEEYIAILDRAEVKYDSIYVFE